MENTYLSSVKKQFTSYKTVGEKTFDQLTDEQLFWQPNEESNSIATIVAHMHGNMLSRWTDFLTSDGEKEWRNRCYQQATGALPVSHRANCLYRKDVA